MKEKVMHSENFLLEDKAFEVLFSRQRDSVRRSVLMSREDGELPYHLSGYRSLSAGWAGKHTVPGAFHDKSVHHLTPSYLRFL